MFVQQLLQVLVPLLVPHAPRPLYIGPWTIKAHYPIHVLLTLFGCLDGGKGLGHNLLMQFSTLGSSKMEIFKTDFFLCSDHS